MGPLHLNLSDSAQGVRGGPATMDVIALFILNDYENVKYEFAFYKLLGVDLYHIVTLKE
jgi:hypothetical protein